jgi:hypothetical protein
MKRRNPVSLRREDGTVRTESNKRRGNFDNGIAIPTRLFLRERGRGVDRRYPRLTRVVLHLIARLPEDETLIAVDR